MPTIAAQLILLLILLATPVPAQITGNLGGCVTDGLNNPRPGAIVSATTFGRKVTTPTDRDGCYVFKALPPGLYRITTRLKGFDNLTRDRIRVSGEETRRLNFTMSAGPICDCLGPGKTLRELARAHAIVYARITDPGSESASPRGYFRQTANVLETLKYHTGDQSPLDAATKALHNLLRDNPGAGSIQTTLTFLQGQSNGSPEPYEPGEEFVLFLTWVPSERSFTTQTRHSADGSDRDTVFVIRDGRIARSPTSLARFTGQPVETLLAELRRFSE